MANKSSRVHEKVDTPNKGKIKVKELLHNAEREKRKRNGKTRRRDGATNPLQLQCGG